MTEEDARQIAMLMREHSLWLTEQYERAVIAGQPQGLTLAERLAEEKSVARHAVDVYMGYMTLRSLHFAQRANYYKRGGVHLEMIAAWTPPDWTYNVFPLPASDMEAVTLDYIVDAMHGYADLCTPDDGTPLGRVLHVAHMLVSSQGNDGAWPAVLNLRTGEGSGEKRSRIPRQLMRRLNRTLQSTEFDTVIRRIEAGMSDVERIKEGIQGWDVK